MCPLDPSGCIKSFISIAFAHPSALMAPAIASTSVWGLKEPPSTKERFGEESLALTISRLTAIAFARTAATETKSKDRERHEPG